MVKVIEVCGLGYGGIQNVVYSICREKCPEIEYYIFGVDCGDNNIDRYKAADVNVIILPNGTTKLKYLLSYAKTLIRIKPDCVHLHQFYASGMLALISRFLRVKKVIIQSHNTRGRGRITPIRRIYILFSKFLIQIAGTNYIAVSQDSAKELFTSHIIKSAKFILIRNGIDFSLYEKSNKNLSLIDHPFFNRDYKVIVSVGRLTKQKNFPFLLSIMKRIVDIDSKVRLIIIGDGEDREKLMIQKENLELNDYVDFIGFSDNVSSYLHQSDLFVLPSLWEGFGIVYLEAQASGLWCLASSCLPHEVDMGGMIFVDLEAGEMKWAQKSIELLNNNEDLIIDQNLKSLFDENKIRFQYQQIYLG